MTIIKNHVLIIIFALLCLSCSKQTDWVNIINEPDIITSKYAILFKDSRTATIDELVDIPVTSDGKEHYLSEVGYYILPEAGIENIEVAEIRDNATNVRFFWTVNYDNYGFDNDYFSEYEIHESDYDPFTPYNNLYYLCFTTGEGIYYLTYKVGSDKYRRKIIRKP
jgi:hypothetical protein